MKLLFSDIIVFLGWWSNGLLSRDHLFNVNILQKTLLLCDNHFPTGIWIFSFRGYLESFWASSMGYNKAKNWNWRWISGVEIVWFEHRLYLVLQEVPQILILLFLLFINRMYTMSATRKASHKPFLHKYENLLFLKGVFFYQKTLLLHWTITFQFISFSAPSNPWRIL